MSARSIRRCRRRGPARPPSQSWRTFLSNHAQAIWAADLFVVQTLTFQTLYVFFLISDDRRRLLHFDVTAHPTAAWICLRAKFLLRYGDSKFTAAFDEVFKSEGVEIIRLRYRRPVANAFVERWVGSARREVLDHMLIFGRRHLEKVLAEHIDHYNHARPHQGIEQRPPCEPTNVIPPPTGRVERRDWLGGVLREYSRAAA